MAVAKLLAAVPSTGSGGGFAARMGGEEFLLVFIGMTPTDALRHLEALRRTVADHSWHATTGGLPVTVSIGVSTVLQDDTPSTLLARADRSLYEAKRAGRDRICIDPAHRVGQRRRYRG